MFKKGDKVVQVQPAPIAGEVAGFGICQETGEKLIRVEYADADGSLHARDFKEGDLKAADLPAA